jgi:hypothetical protein
MSSEMVFDAIEEGHQGNELETTASLITEDLEKKHGVQSFLLFIYKS